MLRTVVSLRDAELSHMEGIVDGCSWTLYVSSGRRDRFRCCLLFLTVVVSVLALPTKTLASPVAPINADVAMTC